MSRKSKGNRMFKKKESFNSRSFGCNPYSAREKERKLKKVEAMGVLWEIFCLTISIIN